MLRVKAELLKHGISSNAFSATLGMHPSTMSAITTGRMRPYPSQAQRIARELEWPEGRESELFEEIGEEAGADA